MKPYGVALIQQQRRIRGCNHRTIDLNILR